ncbi:molecular chaperone Hsp33 [Kushneria sinocarnis]|uniref:33 kDa chaperonin n=1 Tax=Kushneria sinocarnis TaxID=595502 RepID=A0A420WWW6_9GAMM|nr:Hsp33 family molecular chaperone HslO [Kushneria sinocarnis]RKR04208.1 molecular chaperone Hsp33 [Kushneria sinocarnis]
MDRIQRFIFDQTNVRGELVNAPETLREVRSRHADYPEPVAHQLGEMLAAVALLTATVKLDGVLSLEVRGNGPVSLLMAESNPATAEQGQQLRAIARFNDVTAVSGDSAGLAELVGEGQIVMTLDPKEGQRYQGIVGLEADTLAGCLEAYFERSEQLPTRLWLAADAEGAAGLLLQQLPDDERNQDPDAWNRLAMLADTISQRELLDLAPLDTLNRLFHEDNPRLFDPAPVEFGCTCSRERFANGLHQLGAEELRSIVAEQGEIETHCHFCNTRYVFSAAAVESLIDSPDDSSPIVH